MEVDEASALVRVDCSGLLTTHQNVLIRGVMGSRFTEIGHHEILKYSCAPQSGCAEMAPQSWDGHNSGIIEWPPTFLS